MKSRLTITRTLKTFFSMLALTIVIVQLSSCTGTGRKSTSIEID